MKVPDSEELARFLKFGVTGVLNTAIDFAIFTLLGMGLNLNIYLAQTAGYACATLNSYIVNRSWTFSSKNRFFSAELVRFLAANVLTLLLSYAALYVLQRIFPGAGKLVLKLPIIVLTMVVNFVLSRLWVFRKGQRGTN